jgi:signal transduction histidine kinase
MLELREDVFNLWESRVREEVKQAHGLLHPILLNTLPPFYDNIAESVTGNYPRSSAVDGVTLASEHGGERARITSYNHGALIQEYQIFRWAIFDVLTREGVALNRLEIHAINAAVDAGIQMAVEGFSLVNSGLRERFAAALTHDMRGPLGVTSTALELVLMSNDLARIKTAAAKALANVHRMSGMIDELLNTMTFHSGERLQLHLVQFDIAEVAKEVQTDSISTYGPHFEFFCVSLIGWWDRSALKRAFENLVSNAVKYGRPETPITIRINEVHQRLVLWVHNEGDPIPPDEQESIFQMYRRAEAAKNSDKVGWGIGLPYVRAVAESHGGSIGVDSGGERGTTFIIDIPVDCRPFLGAPSLA